MGDTEAMCEIARAHVRRGELDAAETWVRRALAGAGGTGAGQAMAEFTMGMLMEVRGRPREEERQTSSKMIMIVKMIMDYKLCY